MTAFIRRQFSGAARNTTTTALLGVSGTSVDISATTGWPSVAGIPFYVVINPSSLTEEKCLATISGSTLTLTRAQDDTTASEHAIGSVIYPVFTANDADESNELVSKLTTKGDLLVTDGTNLIRLGVGADGYFLKASSSASVGIEWASIPTINNLNDIGDVSITTAEEGDFLVYKNSASAWINETIHFITVSDTAPTDEIREGDLWYNSLELELYTYFSNSWIQVTETQSGPQELYELIDVLIDDPEYGQTLVYNGTEWENSVIQSALTLENPRVISLSGDVSGSVAFDGSQDVSIATTIQLNGVALGADTTGSYVESLVAGTGVTLSNNSGESATPTIAIGQAVGTTSSVAFAHIATDSLNVTNNVIGGGNITLSPNVSSYEIGDTGPAGGKIFITPSTSGNTTGKYFEVAPISGQVIRTWATDTVPGVGLGNAATSVVGADGTDIGTGQQNTADIVAQTGNVEATSAAVYCDQYTYGGFSDWFLPSKDELNELYIQRNIVGGITASYYSTSSEYSYEAFWFQSFIDGNPNTPYKNNAYYIRPVRSFVAPAPAGIITGNLTGNVTGNVTGNSSTATTLQTARTISLTGDVSGSVSFDGSANASIAATIQPNSVALGTDTTGNYMSALTQGTGVTITHTPGEGSNATIAIGQAVGTSASVTFANLTVTGDLTVSGTTTAINTTELMVDDNLVVLNSNVTAAPTENAGIEVERGSSANVSLRWNETSDKWEITEDGSAYLEVATTADISTAALTSISDIPDVSTAYQLGGPGPAGGIIFITPDTVGNSTGKYFEVAPSASQVQRSWATGANQSLAVSGADETGFGFGSQNTTNIVAQSGNVSATSAAAYASGYEYGGFSDWFLPSLDELQELYAIEDLDPGAIPGLLGSNYWSSTEHSATQAKYENLGDGGQGFSAKSNALYVRPVRAFNSPAYGDFLKWSGSYWTNDPINLGTDTTGNSDNITEGTTNLYFTDGRARSALLADNAGTASGIRFIAPNTGTVELISQEATRFVRVTSNAAAGGGKTEIQGSAQILASSSISDPGHLTVAGSVTVGGGVVFEGATANDYETSLVATDPTADRTITLPDADGTVALAGSIALGTDTTGNYMSDLTQGTGVTITHTPGEGSNATIAIGQDVSTSASPTFVNLNLDGNIVFEGTTANEFETTLQVVDPTADRTVSIPDESGTLAIGQNVSTSASVTFANVTATGNVAISGRIDKTTIRESVADTSVSASVVTANYATGDIFYIGTAPASNFTVNLTNAPTDDGKAITVVLFVTQGATGYYPNVVQVAGSAQTIKWANGAAPTPTSSAGKIDIFSFTFVRRSAAWTVFGSSNLGY